MNNKKRSLEVSSSTPLNNINENGIEKTFNNKYNEFINKDYDSFELPEIVKYAEELGISNEGRKYEIYNRIEQFLLSQISSIKEIRESEEINPFNKGVIQLLIKEIDNTERLFWSIFRNKPIFKEIFSNFKYKRSYTFERLYDIDYILSSFSNGLKILKDKIKCNSHLNTSFEEISKVLKKDTTENRELLNLIFQKYSKSIDIQDVIEKSIVNQNLFLLKYLKVNGEMLKGRLYYISYKQNYRSLKTLNYLNELGIDYKESKHDFFPYYFSIFSDFKLKHLIYLIDKLPIFVKLNKKELKLYNNFKSSISKLNISFTNEQLHSTIFQLLCHHSEILIKDEITTNSSDVGSINKDSIQSLKSNILKYVDLLNKIYMNECDQTTYLLLFKDINQIKSTIVSNTLKASHFFEFFKLKTNMHYDFIKYLNDANIKNFLSFKKLIFKSNDLELIQLAFEKYGSIFKDLRFLEDFIEIEVYSIEFLNFFFENYQDSTDLFQDNNIYYLNIQDLPTLLHYEKLMFKLGRKFKFRYPYNLNNLWNVQIFKRSISNPVIYTVNQLDLDLTNVVYNIYFKYGYLLSILETGHTNLIRIKNIENKNFIISLLENHLKSPITTIDQIFDCEDSIYKIRFYSSQKNGYIFGNFKVNGKVLIEVEIGMLFKYLYECGRYEEIFQINHSNDWVLYGYGFGFHCQYSKEYIDLLFSYSLKDGKLTNNNISLHQIIYMIIKANHLSIFKLFTFKYNFYFIEKSNPFAEFRSKQLKEFLKYSIDKNYVEIAELLLNYTTITKSEFCTIKSKDCPIFKNLYNKLKKNKI